MNCKPGDLAVVVKSHAGNEGKIVRCVEYTGLNFWPFIGVDHSWRIDSSLRSYAGTYGNDIADSQLRPIRDNDGEDETLTWAGKPESINA
jgi:hypothetical protein